LKRLSPMRLLPVQARQTLLPSSRPPWQGTRLLPRPSPLPLLLLRQPLQLRWPLPLRLPPQPLLPRLRKP
jgi:hypothetical protein